MIIDKVNVCMIRDNIKLHERRKGINADENSNFKTERQNLTLTSEKDTFH